MHDRAVDRAEAGQRVAVALPGIERDEISRGDALVGAAAPIPSPTGSTSRSRTLGEVPAAAHRPPRHRRRPGARRPQGRLRAAPARAACRRGARRPRRPADGHDRRRRGRPRPASSARASTRSGSSGSSRGEAIVYLHPSGASSLAHLGELDGVERCRRLGLLGRTGSTSSAPRCERAPRRRRPARPRDRRAGRAVGAGDRPAARARAARLAALPPGRDRPRPKAAEELLAELELAGFNPVKVDDAGARAGCSSSRASSYRLGDEHAVGTGAYEQARAALVAECTAAGSITLARFRDLLGHRAAARTAPARAVRRRRRHPPRRRRSACSAAAHMTFSIALVLVVFGVVAGPVGARADRRHGPVRGLADGFWWCDARSGAPSRSAPRR